MSTPRSLSARTLRSKIDPAYRQFIVRFIEWPEHGFTTITYRYAETGNLIRLNLTKAGYVVTIDGYNHSVRVELPKL